MRHAQLRSWDLTWEAVTDDRRLIGWKIAALVLLFLLAACVPAFAHREPPAPQGERDTSVPLTSLGWVIASAKTRAQLRPHVYGFERDCLAALRLLRIPEGRCVEAKS